MGGHVVSLFGLLDHRIANLPEEGNNNIIYGNSLHLDHSTELLK